VYDFPTPPHLIEAVHKAMVDGYNGYADSLGIKPAVEAIRNEAEGRGFKNIQGIFVGYGSGEVIDSCLTALVNPGRQRAHAQPRVPAVLGAAGQAERHSNAYDLDEENGWQPDLADLETQDQRPHAGHPADQSRTIPTGAVCSRETLEKVADIARRHNLLMFADEIYDKLIIDDDIAHTSIAALAPDLPVITFNGLSKAYLAPGWRIGWAIATGPPSR
jgi:alanine-synthesizing transaminase